MIDIRSKTRWVTFFDAHFSVVIFFHYFLILSLFFSGIVFFATFSKNCTLTRAQQITEPGAIQPLEKIFCSLFRLSAFFFFFAFRNKAQKNLRFLTWMANPHREEANQSSLYPARKNDQTNSDRVIHFTHFIARIFDSKKSAALSAPGFSSFCSRL